MPAMSIARAIRASTGGPFSRRPPIAGARQAFAANRSEVGRIFDPLESWNCPEAVYDRSCLCRLLTSTVPAMKIRWACISRCWCDAKTVRVVVVRRVLQDMKSSPLDGEGNIARFEAFRKEFEAIASDKFDGGHGGGKIEITSSDMVKFLVERLNAS